METLRKLDKADISENNVTGHIYILLFPSGKRYVGQTIHNITKRIWQHWHPSKREENFPVHRAMKKCGKRYGKDSVKVEKTLTLKCTQEYLDLIEDRAIVMFNTLVPNGYNLKRGGSHGAHSEETKVKMSASHMGKPSPMKGKPGTMKGKHHSEESRAKMSAAKKGQGKGRHLSEETKAKMSTIKRGRHLSEETKAKLSAAKRGKPKPPRTKEHRAKLSAAGKGRHISEETRAKISVARKDLKRKVKFKEAKWTSCIVARATG